MGAVALLSIFVMVFTPQPLEPHRGRGLWGLGEAGLSGVLLGHGVCALERNSGASACPLPHF